MKEKIKNFIINFVKILVFILIWMLLFHSCNRPTQYEKGYQQAIDDYNIEVDE